MSEEKPKRGRKTNVGQYEQRMVEVFEMILYNKLSFTDFKKQASERFNITQRQAENLYSDAKERLNQRFTQEREEILQEQIARHYNLLMRCRESGNRKVESEVLRDLTKLYGLEQTKLDITSGGEPITIQIKMS